MVEDAHSRSQSRGMSEKESAANLKATSPVDRDAPPRVLSRRETFQELAAEIGEHFQELSEEPHVPWAAPTPGHSAAPSLSSSPESPAKPPLQPLPDGWEIHIHPNGSIYYYNKDYKLTSNFDVRRTASSHDIFLRVLRESPGYGSHKDHWEVNLTRREHTNGYIWIDHENRAASEFNQHPNDFADAIEEDDVVARLAREERYWTYVQGHPNHFKSLPPDVWQDACDALSWCYADRLLFKHTNATFSKDDSKDLLEMLERLRGSEKRWMDSASVHDASEHAGPSVALRNWFIASILRAFAADRQGTHYGQHDAPAYREREVDDMIGNYDSLSPSMQVLYYGLGIAMFLGIPHTYFRRIQDVDRTRFKDGVNGIRWKAFIQALLKEWNDSNLLATVLISATVAFIAVPGLEDNSRMLGLFSVILSIGSVLVGMFFVWHHQSRAESSADVGLNYFMHAKHFTNSSVPLAFILSVPVVLLLWSFLCFITALLLYAFHGTQQVPGNDFAPFSRATSPTTLGMFCLVLACAFLAWMFMLRVWTCRKPHHDSSVHRPTMMDRALGILDWARSAWRWVPSCCTVPSSRSSDFVNSPTPMPYANGHELDEPPTPQKTVTIELPTQAPPPPPEESRYRPSRGKNLTDPPVIRRSLQSPTTNGDRDEVLPFIRSLFPDADAHDVVPVPKSMVARPVPTKQAPGGNVKSATAPSRTPEWSQPKRSRSLTDLNEGIVQHVFGIARGVALQPAQARERSISVFAIREPSKPSSTARRVRKRASTGSIKMPQAERAVRLPGPPKLTPLNVLGLDAVPPPQSSTSMHRRSSDPTRISSFDAAFRAAERARPKRRGSWSMPMPDASSLSVPRRTGTADNVILPGRSLNPFQSFFPDRGKRRFGVEDV